MFFCKWNINIHNIKIILFCKSSVSEYPLENKNDQLLDLFYWENDSFSAPKSLYVFFLIIFHFSGLSFSIFSSLFLLLFVFLPQFSCFSIQLFLSVRMNVKCTKFTFWYQRLFSKLKAASGRDIKGHFFPVKNY